VWSCKCVYPFIDPRSGKRWSDGPRGCEGGLRRCHDDFSRPNDVLRDTGHQNLSILTDAIYMRFRGGGGSSWKVLMTPPHRPQVR
jgi:hypothetical protein